MRWEQTGDDQVDIDLIPDHARVSPNQQATHWNFRLISPPERIGTPLRFRFRRFRNCWNGHFSEGLQGDCLTSVFSQDGQTWQALEMAPGSEAGIAREFELKITAPVMYIAHLVPYTESYLASRLSSFSRSPHCRISELGKTVDGRGIERVTLGCPDAPKSVLLRGRSHPWESGGSWLLDGLLEFLLSGATEAEEILGRVRFELVPMSNKDGVYRGLSRFNVCGMDLNRDWQAGVPCDPELCPENACLQRWLDACRSEGRLPDLAICLHNDGGGNLHFSHPEAGVCPGYADRMALFEKRLREMTWFREGAVRSSFRNTGTFGEGLCEIYGIDAFIYELRSSWAEGLGRTPMPDDWRLLGKRLCFVLDRYLSEIVTA